MAGIDPTLAATARAWLDEDPDPRTVGELQDLLAAVESGDAEAAAELADAFDGTLAFGTAGLRGRLGPGSNRMNRVVVARAAAGLAAHLQAIGGRSVVIGYDARRNSDVFARDTAEIMAGAGLEAHLFPRALPTPVTAFAVRHLGCAAGVMVTASHNPPDDNGYKVYLGDGRQIVPPSDAEIAACIAAVGSVHDIPRSETYTVMDETTLDAYVSRVGSLPGPGPRDVSAVYTPLHGVGGAVFDRAVVAAGFAEPWPVAAQFTPDGTFPTVHFPNPEEPGAMDLALAEASERGVDVIVANDPDADRMAAGIPAATGGYRMLTGDEVGAFLAWWIVQRRDAAGLPREGVLAQSIVSGTLLRAIAEDAGLGYEQTLTGFKWITRAEGMVYGYEEALGYCVDPEYVADKDGMSASLLFLEAVSHLKAAGRGVQDVLDDLARQHGLHVTAPLSVRVADISLISDAMARLRQSPPTELGGRPVERVDDLSLGVDGLPPTDGLRFTLPGARVVVRPSGTEPKLKCYLQVVVPVETTVEAARVDGDREMATLRHSVATAIGIGG